jgi:hypothetical protein
MKVLNKMSSSDSIHLSMPPKFEGKRGTTFVIWDIKFRSWAEVKRISEAHQASTVSYQVSNAM